MRRIHLLLGLVILAVAALVGVRYQLAQRPASRDELASATFAVAHLGMPGDPAYWITVNPDGQVTYEEGTSEGKRSSTRTKQLSPTELIGLRTVLKEFPALVGEYDSGSTMHSHLYLDLTRADGSTSTISLQHGPRATKVLTFIDEINAVLGREWEIRPNIS